MKIRRVSTLLVTSSIIAFGTLGVDLLNVSNPLLANAQVSVCDSNIRNVGFSGKVGSTTGVNLRSSRTLSSRTNLNEPYNKFLNFDAWAYGETVNDLWTGSPDARWFRVWRNGVAHWVPSAYILGNPPGNPPLQPKDCYRPIPNLPNDFYRKPEVFFNWANGRVGISRLDTRELRGQCVTLVARYVQEVFLPANERTNTRAFSHGKDTARTVATSLSQYFEPYTKNGLPKRGAVISFPGPNTTYGHTGIVLEARTASGQRQVRILESNWDSRAENSSIRIGGWINIDSSANGYGGTNGWTNPK